MVKVKGNLTLFSPSLMKVYRGQVIQPQMFVEIQGLNLWCGGISTIQIIPSGYFCLLTNAIKCHDGFVM